MKRTTVFLDEDVERDLKSIAARKGVPGSSVVREALRRYVSAERKRAPLSLRFLAAGRSGTSDTAERSEEIVFCDLLPARRRRPKGRRAKRTVAR